MNKSVLALLEDWFYSHCDGDWEEWHSSIKIESLSNPGWKVSISLKETKYDGEYFSEIKTDDEVNWIHAKVQDGHFIAYAGPRKLEEAVHIFLNWCNAVDEKEV